MVDEAMGTTRKDESLDEFIDKLSAVATEFFADGEVDVPVLHFLREDGAMGVLPLSLPGLEPSILARLVVGYYDPPVAAVLAEGWATNVALPADISAALDGKRPWAEVSERANKRLAPALKHYPALAEPLKRGDVATLRAKHSAALAYAWNDDTMGPIMREGKSLKTLPAHLRRKILTLFGEDRAGRSRTLMWRIEQQDDARPGSGSGHGGHGGKSSRGGKGGRGSQGKRGDQGGRGGRRHFVEESLDGANEYASRWRPLYMAQELAAMAKVPTAMVRSRVREICGEQLAPYKIVEMVNFTDDGIFFSAPMPPGMQ